MRPVRSTRSAQKPSEATQQDPGQELRRTSRNRVQTKLFVAGGEENVPQEGENLDGEDATVPDENPKEDEIKPEISEDFSGSRAIYLNEANFKAWQKFKDDASLKSDDEAFSRLISAHQPPIKSPQSQNKTAAKKSARKR